MVPPPTPKNPEITPTNIPLNINSIKTSYLYFTFSRYNTIEFFEQKLPFLMRKRFAYTNQIYLKFKKGLTMSEEEILNHPINYDKLMDIGVELVTELGSVTMTVKNFMKLQKGSVIDLEKPAGESVELYINGKIIGKGEVIVFEDNLAVRINEILDSDTLIQYFKKEKLW